MVCGESLVLISIVRTVDGGRREGWVVGTLVFLEREVVDGVYRFLTSPPKFS